ncbi:hypothetical protein L873DRAFT_1821614, partial [Choiromyces venosus 120613-1]
SKLLSHPLGQAYSAELFRHTLSWQLSTCTTTISDPPGNSLYGNTCRSSTSSNQIAPRCTQPRYRVINIRQPWANVGTTSYHYISSQTTATTTAHSLPENHILVQIPDQKWQECAVCQYAFRTGQREGHQRPKLSRS